jgi:FtsH-binding integral membrane protein
MNWTKEQFQYFGNAFLGLAIFILCLQLSVITPETDLWKFLSMANGGVVGLSIAFYCKARNRSEFWGVLGFAIGFFGYIALIFLPEIESKSEQA